jgi:hypothetical protein
VKRQPKSTCAPRLLLWVLVSAPGCGSEVTAPSESGELTPSAGFTVVHEGASSVYELSAPEILCTVSGDELVVDLLPGDVGLGALRARLIPFGRDGEFVSDNVSIAQKPGGLYCPGGPCAAVAWSDEDLRVESPGTNECTFTVAFGEGAAVEGQFDCPHAQAPAGVPVSDLVEGFFACIAQAE